MPLEITEHYYSPDDPNDRLSRLVRGEHPDEPAVEDVDTASPWVDADYTTVASEGLAGCGPWRNWPGPPLIMPGGLLPDGQPHSKDDMDNARRIMGRPVRSAGEADYVVSAYRVQQSHLREELGLPRPERMPPSFELEDAPDTLVAIVRLHARERARRATRRRYRSS